VSLSFAMPRIIPMFQPEDLSKMTQYHQRLSNPTMIQSSDSARIYRHSSSHCKRNVRMSRSVMVMLVGLLLCCLLVYIAPQPAVGSGRNCDYWNKDDTGDDDGDGT
jgi:hypothetical protein